MPTRILIEGERANFARPEFRRDLISYDLITPHAARGVLDAIYWRPGMTWVIDSICILNPIQRVCVQERDRRVLMLRDVRYLIEAHFDLAPTEPSEAAGRHAAMFKRAMRSEPAPYLGCAGLNSTVRLVDRDTSIASDIACEPIVDHGWLLHSVCYNGDRRKRFFRAQAFGGVVQVPATDDPQLFA